MNLAITGSDDGIPSVWGLVIILNNVNCVQIQKLTQNLKDYYLFI